MKTTKTQRLQPVSALTQRGRDKRSEMLYQASFLLDAMGVDHKTASKLATLAEQARAGEIGADL